MPSFFDNAHNFGFRDIISAGNYYAQHDPTKDPRERLLEHSTIGALYNSAERCDAPKCHPQTRVAVQEEIFGWITHGENDAQPKKVLWMSGPAGTGKTAIAGSIAELCKAKGQLAANFFFSSLSSSRERCSKNRLITTIAYQLQQHDSLQDVGRWILASVDRNPAVFQLRLMDQLEQLILVPLREVQREEGDTSSWPKAIIIDGLDEVNWDIGEAIGPTGTERSKDEVHLEILSVLLHAINDPAFPFRILVVSRPENAIRRFFSTKDAGDVTREMFLDEKYDPDADITLFLRSKFAVIREEYGLPTAWPTEDAIHSLVRNASGQFIYADTVVRYVSDKTKLPQSQLDRVLNISPPADGESNPLATLDALYTRILETSPDPNLAALWIYHITSQGGPQNPALFWRQFLELEQGEGVRLLSNLTSLFAIQDPGDPLSPYVLYHKSLYDFLSDRVPVKSRIYFGGTSGHDEFYATRLFRVVKNRGPAATQSMSVTERKAFLRNFATNCFITRQFCLLFRSSPYRGRDLDLSSLEVEWLIRMLLSFFTTNYIFTYDSQRGIGWFLWSEGISTCFSDVHCECPWYACRPVCHVWRTAILQVCKEQGWRAPGRWMLVKNRFKRASFAGHHSETGDEIWLTYPCGADFSPPPNPRHPSDTGLMVSAQDGNQRRSKPVAHGRDERPKTRTGLGLFPSF